MCCAPSVRAFFLLFRICMRASESNDNDMKCMYYICFIHRQGFILLYCNLILIELLHEGMSSIPNVFFFDNDDDDDSAKLV